MRNNRDLLPALDDSNLISNAVLGSKLPSTALSSDSYDIYKIFEGDSLIGTRNNGLSSKYKNNRDYLITSEVAHELNKYRTFTPLVTFTDAYTRKFKAIGKNKQGEDIMQEMYDQETGPIAVGVKSIFNKYGVVLLGGNARPADQNNPGTDVTADNNSAASSWRISNNVPVMDSPTTRKRIKQNSGCSIKELVRASQVGALGRELYDYSDFMYCKHLGKMTNNYMITLRRFPLPVDDFISSVGESQRGNVYTTSNNAHSIGCLVTWLGTPGNEMENILKYSYSMPFVEKNAEWQKSEEDPDAHNSGHLHNMSLLFDSAYRKSYMAGNASTAVQGYFDKLLPNWIPHGVGPYNAREFNSYRDQNKVYGPVDAIKSSYIRDAGGLTFAQSFTLTFEYELKSYNGINGRQAMLDLLSNILNVTYSTGTFWGGGFYGGGAHQNNIFTNLKIFQPKGGLHDFVDAFTEDLNTIKTAGSNYFAGKDAKTIIKQVWNQGMGMLLAGMLNKMGRPEKHYYNSILSPAPVGLWHVTIGNPHHPIMSMGNMILKSTSITHTGPLGLDDFPTGIKVVCELDRGKPRDIRAIEQLYMHGNDRIFYSMGNKIEDLYEHSVEYKGSRNCHTAVKYNSTKSEELFTNIEKINSNDIKGKNKAYAKAFGLIGSNCDKASILTAASEMEYGSSIKKQKDK